MTNPGDYVEHDFPGFGVKIYAPSWVKVTFTRLDRDPKYERTQAGFTFRRLVGNLKFETTGTDQFSFDPPARLHARVPDDLRPRRNGLKLAWWNGSQWVPLSELSGDADNLAVAITSITDPPISWGT